MPKKEPTAVRVRRLREFAQMSVPELATASGLHRATLYRLERDTELAPQMATLAALAHVFRVTIGQVRGTEALRKGGDS